MSIVFSDTTTKKGLVQFFEKECGFQYGDVSGSATLLEYFAAQVNVALDDFMTIALRAGGTWQVDDDNELDYPIVTASLVAGQRDYPFTVDGSGHLILAIHKVYAADASGTFHELLPVDVETDASMPAPSGNLSGVLDPLSLMSFTDGKNAQGIPIRYDKLANGIFLDPIPSYTLANGLKLYVDREATYFTTSDTTKKPGVPGTLHKYFYLKPAREYARQNTLANFSVLDEEVKKLEGDAATGRVGIIAQTFANRSKDERKALQIGQDSNR